MSLTHSSVLSPQSSQNTQSFDQIPAAPLQWLWHPYLPLGKITLLLGDPDAGKSLLSLHLAAQLSTASPMPTPPLPSPNAPNPPPTSPPSADGGYPTPSQSKPPPTHKNPPPPISPFSIQNSSFSIPAATLLVATEDEGPRDTLRPRLQAANAHLPSIHRLKNFHSLVPPRPTRLNPNPPHPLARVEAALSDNPAIKLLIIDSLPAFLGNADHLNPGAAQDPTIPRTILASLAALAEQYQIAILAISRLTKSVSPKLLHRAAGSHAFTFRTKSALLLSVDPEAPASHRRLLIPLKHNLAAPPPTLAFHITPAADAPTLTWEEKPLPLAPHQIAQLSPPEHRRNPATLAAADWLTSALTPGPLTSARIKELASENCISPTTLFHAKEHLGILSIKQGRIQWWWKLPTDPSPIPPPNHSTQSLQPHLR